MSRISDRLEILSYQIMTLSTDDTIIAIASAAGGALRGILRVSGPDTRQVLERCFDPVVPNALAQTKAASVISGNVRLSAPFQSLPCDIYYWPHQRSYTRQPTAEIHTIGSPPLLDAALRTFCAAGARLAEPGEFTLRAFLAGRLDLTQAEAVLGVIDAGSRAELDVALQQLAGGLAGPLHELRNRLLELLAHLEAGLDFVDEDIEFITDQELDRQLAESVELVHQLAQQMATRGETRGEARVVLMGRPNVGKSSLLNALAGEGAAIVADEPGTTRDYLARRVVIGGLPCLLIDTAGIDADVTPDSLADRAQTMSHQQHKQAQLQLFCVDASRPLKEWEKRQLSIPENSMRLVVWTKVDRAASFPNECEGLSAAISTSSVTGQGIQHLRAAIARQLSDCAAQDSNVVAGTAIRCQDSLRLAAESLSRARDIAQQKLGEELVAAELRVALEELGRVVGAVYTDDILDRIFSRFCIGK